MSERAEHRLNAFLLLWAFVFVWCAGVNAATHHWRDMVGEFLMAAFAMGLRAWKVSVTTDER